MGKPQPRQRNKAARPTNIAKPPGKIQIPPEARAFIKQNYKKMPRTQIAKSLGIDKVTLNLMIIQMRIGG